MTLTPPGWAHPYATVWDDFSGSLAIIGTSSSGAAWVLDPSAEAYDGQPEGYVGLAGQARRGLTGGGRVGVAGPRPFRSDEIAAVGTSNVAISASLLVTGATWDAVYVRSEVYIVVSGGAGAPFGSSEQYLYLADAPVIDTVVGAVNGYNMFFLNNDGDRLTQVTVIGFLSNGDIGGQPTLIDVDVPGLVTGWHTAELRVGGGRLSAYLDGALLGTAVALPIGARPGVELTYLGEGGLPLETFGTVTLAAVPYAGWFGLHDLRGADPPFESFWDNFEAGPLPLPTPVPSLRAVPGPTSLHFQPPRINT